MPISNNSDILVVIVTYNAVNCIQRCLRHVRDSTADVDVLVIDNASTDNTLDLVREFPNVEILGNDTNLGFGRANNIGLRKVVDEDYRYALLLNQDAYLFPDAVETMTRAMDGNPGYGVLGALEYKMDGRSLDNQFFGYLTGYARQELENSFLHGKHSAIVDLPQSPAACWLVSRACIEKVGGFDPLFFMYGEDDDYSNRVTYHGFKVGVVTSSGYIHEKTMAAVKPSLRQLRDKYVNRAYSIKVESLKRPGEPFALLWTLRQIIARAAGNAAVFQFAEAWLQCRLLWRLTRNGPRIRRHKKLCEQPPAGNPLFL